MTQVVPVTVAARNEQGSIAACLRALLASIDQAEARLPLRFDVLVVADDCSDATAAIAAALPRVRVVTSSGGKVEAQRRGVREGPFLIFSDADILIRPDTVTAVASAMLDDASVQVAFPGRRPLPPRRRTPLAAALHAYNLHRGWSSQRTWFNGKFFAIRSWPVPSRAEVASRLAGLADDPFLDLAAGLVADDVYLSREVVRRHGVAALRETPAGLIEFRAPETLVGMYRYYRRLRREFVRIDLLFPETVAVHRQFGRRRADRLAAAPRRERAQHAVFCAALLLCRAAYAIDRAWCHRFARARPDAWKPIPESKLS